jgi:hypothetical protein
MIASDNDIRETGAGRRLATGSLGHKAMVIKATIKEIMRILHHNEKLWR